jgi:hypothetical protein
MCKGLVPVRQSIPQGPIHSPKGRAAARLSHPRAGPTSPHAITPLVDEKRVIHPTPRSSSLIGKGTVLRRSVGVASAAKGPSPAQKNHAGMTTGVVENSGKIG